MKRVAGTDTADSQKKVKSLVLLKDLMHTEKYEHSIVIMAGGEEKG